GGFIESVEEEARALELDGEEEGRRGVDALDLAALRGLYPCAARLDVVRPELEARGVGLAVEEVVVVLADEEGGGVHGVRGGRSEVVVVDDERGTVADPDDGAGARGLPDEHLDGLVRLLRRV